MKTMTCKQLGGPCDQPLHGDTADAVIKAQDLHLRAMVADGDDTHADLRNELVPGRQAELRRPPGRLTSAFYGAAGAPAVG
jgi:hypothetical protein